MEYYSAIKKNAFESVLMRWMNTKRIIQNEVGQKEKDKYHMLTHTYRMEYHTAIKRNAFESVLMRQMSLEPIIQSEVSQKEKDKYHILMPIYGI